MCMRSRSSLLLCPSCHQLLTNQPSGASTTCVNFVMPRVSCSRAALLCGSLSSCGRLAITLATSISRRLSLRSAKGHTQHPQSICENMYASLACLPAYCPPARPPANPPTHSATHTHTQSHTHTHTHTLSLSLGLSISPCLCAVCTVCGIYLDVGHWIHHGSVLAVAV